MTVKRLILVLPALAALAACGGGSPAEDGRSASGEVLEGTISDAMLPVDRVRSEPPLEDPEAFARARSDSDDAATADAPEGEDGAPAASDSAEADAAAPAGAAAAEPEG
jgi:hypothetical protein